LKTLKPLTTLNAHYKEWQYINFVYYTRYRDGDAASFIKRLGRLFDSIQGGKEEVDQPLIFDEQPQNIAQTAGKRKRFSAKDSDTEYSEEEYDLTTSEEDSDLTTNKTAIKIHYMKGNRDTGLYGFILPPRAFDEVCLFLLKSKFHYADTNKDGCFKRTFGLPSTNSFLLDERYMDDNFNEFYNKLDLNTHNIRFDLLEGVKVLSSTSSPLPEKVATFFDTLNTKYNPVLDIDYPRTDFFLFRGGNMSANEFSRYFKKMFGDSAMIMDKALEYDIGGDNKEDNEVFSTRNDNDVMRFGRFWAELLIDRLSKKRTRFVILNLIIFFRRGGEAGDDVSHANFVIFDQETHTYGRYDPHGRSLAYDYNKLDQTLGLFLTRFVNGGGLSFTFDKDYFQGVYCTTVLGRGNIAQHVESFQNLENYSVKYTRVIGDVFGKERLIEAAGYCQAWVFYVMYLTISQGGRPEVEQSFLLNCDNLADIIRSWASNCYNMTNKAYRLEENPILFMKYNRLFNSREDIMASVTNNPYPHLGFNIIETDKN